MKRFTLQSVVTITRNDNACRSEIKSIAHMEEYPLGEWVHHDEVMTIIGDLESQISEKRIAKLERALGFVAEGRCQHCGQMVRGWQSPSGGFAPEIWDTLKEQGVDPATGHRFSCTRPKQ